MKQIKLKELFEKKLTISLKAKNLTSGTKVNELVELASVSVDACVLMLPKNACSLGHQLFLSYQIQGKGFKKKKIEVIGKVIEINPLSEKMSEVKIQFNQFIKEEWNFLLGIFMQKQNDISQIINTLKTPKQ